MKKFYFLFTFLTFGLFSFGQNIEPCFFDSYQRQNKELIGHSERLIQKFTEEGNHYLRKADIKIIPVVVHVIHNGGTENISDAQVQSQIDVLNEDFRKMVGTNGFGTGVDTEIEFNLAEITPNGKCTNGIVRIESALTNHQTYQRSMLKDLSYWDNTRYLNIYVVKSINGSSGILGYASFPGGPADEDGIVVRHNYFGRIGTSASLGRTTTHEVGHWLGLYHPFNNGCGIDVCTDGDYVCDTPPVNNPNYNCITNNSCSNDNPDLSDQIENYMDYAGDACKNMFSLGQKSRMDATLGTYRWNIWQYSNIWSTGCDTNYVSPSCHAVADFTSNSQVICLGNQVLFTNKSLNNCTSYQWYFPGGNPSASTAVNPTVTYNSAGIYNVSLKATNAFGADSVAFSGYITVVNPPAGQALPFSEDFETNIFPPNGIIIDNPDGGITWERDTIAVTPSGTASAKINNLINTNYGQTDALILPNVDLTYFTAPPYLQFKWAYAKSYATYSDELLVLISTDCGVNWTQIFYRSGTNLVTGPTQTTPYVPDSSTVWKSADISLNNYALSSNAIIKIVNVTDGGNNLYIDKISVGENSTDIQENTIDEETVLIFPNPSQSGSNIQYTLNKDETVRIELLNSVGQNVFIHEEKQIAGIHTVIIKPEITNSNGIYFIKMITGDKIIIKKFIRF